MAEFKVTKVIVEGEIPEACIECPVLWHIENNKFYCTFLQEQIEEEVCKNTRPEECPLVTHNQAFDWMFYKAKATPYIKEKLLKIFGVD